jgi:hypothetical protein
VGVSALAANTTGGDNTAVGSGALANNITGLDNTAVGSGALATNAGDNNTALGVGALATNITGFFNTAVGADALANKSSGDNNIAIGNGAGTALSSGSNNIYLSNAGPTTPPATAPENNTIRIGTQGLHLATVLAGNVTSNGSFATTSDARLKTNITPLTHVLEKLAQLRGVSFEWNEAAVPVTGHMPGQRDIGVIAQEVEVLFPEFVITGPDGYKAVAYDKLSSVLIAAAKELKAATEAQQQHLVALEARLTTLERAAAIPQTSGRLSFLSLSAGWPLFGGLLLAGWTLRWPWWARRRHS